MEQTNKAIAPTFEQVVKHPVVYALVFIATIAGYFINRYTAVSSDSIKTLTQQLNEERKVNRELTEENRELRMEIKDFYRYLDTQRIKLERATKKE